MSIAKNKNETPRPNHKYMRDKDREMVKGIFRFNEVPGGIMSFVFKAYKEDPVERFDLVDGEVYTLPLGVAKHLNNNCWYPVHTLEMDAVGKSVQRIGQKVHRCNFQSLEFVDIGGLTSDIVTVENIPLHSTPVKGL
jgi:hypothetical protein